MLAGGPNSSNAAKTIEWIEIVQLDKILWRRDS